MPTKIIAGVDYTKFNPPIDSYGYELLYYGNGVMTNKYYIKNVAVYTPQGWVQEGEATIFAVNYKQLKPGDYITTCPILGVGCIAINEEVAFAQVLEVLDDLELRNLEKPVGRVRVKFLQQ